VGEGHRALSLLVGEVARVESGNSKSRCKEGIYVDNEGRGKI